MIKNTSSPSHLATNDIYLAAFLLSKDYSLVKVIKNARRRISFVFTGEGVKELKALYRENRVRTFRESLKQVRHLMDTSQRSNTCPIQNQPQH